MARSTSKTAPAGVLPLGVIRDARIVDANDRLAHYLGYELGELLGKRFLELVAAHDRQRVRERHERRVRGESVPESYEIVLVRKDGVQRHAEVYVALEPSGLVTFELADRSHLASRRARLRALAGLGAAVQREQTEERIFATLAEGLLALGMAWAHVRPDGDNLVVLDVGAPNAGTEQLEREASIEVRGRHGPWTPPARRAWREGSAYADNLPLMAGNFFDDDRVGPIARAVAREQSLERCIALRIDVDHKPAQILIVMGDWLLEEDLAAFGLLRIQISAALDAARVIAHLSARNDELAALNSIGAAAGAGRGLDELFVITAETMLRLLGTRWLAVYLFDERGDAVLTHHTGLPASVVASSKLIKKGGVVLDRVAETGKPMVWYWRNLPPAHQEVLADMRFDVAASVPLVAGARVIGVMNTAYDAEDELEPSHLEVLQAAGAHFAAAVRAKRLLDDLRESYADLGRAQEQLVRRERLAALGELAAIVAHEIRNPLGAVFNAIGAIRHQARAVDDFRLTTLLAILEEEATRMNDIVGDLLDFARPVTAALRPEDIAPIVAEAVETAAKEALGPVEVERDVDEPLPEVPIDARLLRQAILNVALNAVQALGPRGGKLSVRMARDDGAVRIEIADDGPGIASELAERVFEPFFTTRASGTGLGLTVVKRIVDVHRGETALRSAPGLGTTFVIRLPVA